MIWRRRYKRCLNMSDTASGNGYIKKSELCNSCLNKYNDGNPGESREARDKLKNSCTSENMHHMSMFVICGNCKMKDPEVHNYIKENKLLEENDIPDG